jgi:hypothetical protein
MSVFWIEWMRTRYYLQRNPFPSEAIVAEGSGEPCQDGTIFDPTVSSSEVKEFFQKFIIQPTYTRGSSFGALWSLGRGEGARGFGKSALGQYGTKKVCMDFGEAALREYGGSGPRGLVKSLIASYARFDRNNVTSFHSVAFELARWLTEKKRDMYETSPAERLRERVVDKLSQEGQEFSAGSSREIEAIVNKVYEVRVGIPGTKIGPLNHEFLTKLASPEATQVRRYLENVSNWHRVRNGFSYLDTLLTFGKAAGIEKAILFIDQVEDFANTGVPLYKRIKEVERFRDIVKETAPFNSMAYFILTMHPDALSSIRREWENARLPSIDYNLRENRNRVIVLHGAHATEDAEKLFSAYLNYPEYRLPGAPNALHPFTADAVRTIQDLNEGRPGYMLRQANSIIEQASTDNEDVIDATYVDKAVGGIRPDERLRQQERLPPRQLPGSLK